jgi:hypothetical protein
LYVSKKRLGRVHLKVLLFPFWIIIQFYFGGYKALHQTRIKLVWPNGHFGAIDYDCDSKFPIN